MFKVLFKLTDCEAIEYEIEAQTDLEAIQIASRKLNRYYKENILEIFTKRVDKF